MEIIKIEGSRAFSLRDISTTAQKGYSNKKKLKAELKENIKRMAELQNMMYAQDRYALLIVIQAMDAAGKDSLIRRAMSGLNPQGTQVFSFKRPSSEELDHDYLWRAHKRLPERGRIGIFNRSYYEEVLAVRVHDLVRKRKIPKALITGDIWHERFTHIKNFEEYLCANGTQTLKLFLHISKEEQERRFLDRLEDPSKNWKFSAADLLEREHWDEYRRCYENAIAGTATNHAPWYIIPADNKWYARLMVSQIIIGRLEALDLKYPRLSADQTARIDEYRKHLGDSDV